MLINTQGVSLPPPLAAEVDARLARFARDDGPRRLWAGDASLWTGRDEGQWLGWLEAARPDAAFGESLRALRAEIKAEGFTHAVVLGMGGSSLCPEVWSKTFASAPGHPRLLVLDSTDPGEVRAVQAAIDLPRTLFIVSSKSGSTLEPNIFKAHFFECARAAMGAGRAARHFIAVTDPGSQLEAAARADGFRHVFPGRKNIGGRYSALSNFGMVPAAVMGLDVDGLLGSAARMFAACGADVTASANPAVHLGVALGTLAARGIDKLTVLASPGLRDFGAWLEQLVAESTGKQGVGIIPVDRERLGAPEIYGRDRVFAYLRLDAAPDAADDAGVAAIEAAGFPVVRIRLAAKDGLAQEFARWELATAVAGAVMGINPFDQPDVEASKVATRAITDAYRAAGALPAETPFFSGEGVKLYAPPWYAEALRCAAGSAPSLAALWRAHLDSLKPGDYFALLAYLPRHDANEALLQAIRHRVRDARHVATCLGFGPRFLHSTGQAYKGGPNTGVFLQLTCDDAADLPVPGHPYTFGVVKAAQASGDYQVLADRHRRTLRIHLGPDGLALFPEPG